MPDNKRAIAFNRERMKQCIFTKLKLTIQINIKHKILGIILNKTELNVNNLNEIVEEQRQK
jgi:hypothetical protein